MSYCFSHTFSYHACRSRWRVKTPFRDEGDQKQKQSALPLLLPITHQIRTGTYLTVTGANMELKKPHTYYIYYIHQCILISKIALHYNSDCLIMSAILRRILRMPHMWSYIGEQEWFDIIKQDARICLERESKFRT